MTLRNFILPGMAAIAAMLGGMPATAQAQSLSNQTVAEIRQMVAESQARQRGEHLSEPLSQEPQAPPGRPPVIPVVPASVTPVPASEPVKPPPPVVAVIPAQSPATTPASRLGGEITLADIRQEPPNALPQQQAGEEWNPVRFYAEVRSRPNDLTIDAKVEVLTQNGWMFGIQHVNSSGEFRGSNATDSFSGEYIDTRSEFWAGRHGASQDGQTRWSVNGFVRQLNHEDSGKGQSLPGTEYPYSYTWKNDPKPLVQVGARARIERDLIRTESQQLTVHLKGEAAATVSGQSGWAYDVQAGVWYRTAQVEAYGEVGVNNTGAYANGYGRYYLTKSGQLRPFGEVRGEVGSGYHNTQVGGGVRIGLGRNGYAEAILGYNTGTSGDGLAATGRIGFKF